MPHTVIFTPEAEEQLLELFRTIAIAASPEIAIRYIDDLVSYCEGLRTFPRRGTKRDDIRPGLRTMGYRKRVTIAFEINEASVNIIGIFYGGQDYAAALQKQD